MFMFTDCKNQYFENDYATESDLKIQCNPHQYSSQKLKKNYEYNIKASKTPKC